MMRRLTQFLDLFHKRERNSLEYERLSNMKKYMFVGAVGFMISLSLSKYYNTSLVYAF